MAGQQQTAERETSLSEDLEDVINQLEGDEEEEGHGTESVEEEAPQQQAEEVPPEGEEAAGEAAQGAEPAKPAAETKQAYKPPIDWGPQLKQQFKDLPEPVRKAIHDNEVSRAKLMQSTAEDRRVAHTLRQTIEPFRAMMAAEGVQDPLQGIHGLLTTTAQLAFGNQQQKAQRISDLIKHYGVDIEVLDSVLAGQAPPQGQPQHPASDPRVDAIWQRIMQAEQRQVQQTQTMAAGSIQEFAANPKNEFFDDVRYIMADFLDVAAKNNQPMTLEDAYARACAAHPEVANIIAQRWGSQRAQSTSQRAGKKTAAASSISGTRGASGSEGDESSSIRDLLEQQIPGNMRI